MFDLIASQYPRLVRAMRRRHGIGAQETAQMILAARYPGRVAVWTVTDCAHARRLISSAVDARPRFVGAR